MMHLHKMLAARIASAAALSLALLAGAAWADPPERAGRVSALDGSATLQQGDASPVAATLNWPVTSGERLVTAPGSRMEVRVGSTSLQLDGDSSLDIDRLDDTRLDLRLEHGRLALRVRSIEQAAGISITSGEGRFTPTGAGQWHFESGLVPDAHAAAEFDRWIAAHDATPLASGHVSAEMTGAEALDTYGTWTTATDYGPVWYPAGVEADWAPYRYGRWIWIAPWGWTWLDEAPWGFAPSHYGRWALIGTRWGWVPGVYVARPAYAPALVGWIGGGGGVGVASVGWFPLAPFEPYVPAFATSATYLQRVNAPHVRDVSWITREIDVTTLRYANRAVPRAVTVVPAAAMASGRSVARVAISLHGVQRLPGVVRAPTVPAPSRAAFEARAAIAAHPHVERPRPVEPRIVERAGPPNRDHFEREHERPHEMAHEMPHEMPHEMDRMPHEMDREHRREREPMHDGR